MQVLLAGVCQRSRFLALVRDAVIFDGDAGAIVKRLAGYHQFRAVQTAVRETLRAAETAVGESSGRYESGRRPSGDLDDQLFRTFSRCQDLLRQPPTQAETRADLRDRLSVRAGGVVCTAIQKFFPEAKGDQRPELSNRRNIVVIANETLEEIARELVEKVRASTTIEWTLREDVRARLRVMVRRILRKHGYPPDKQEQGQ